MRKFVHLSAPESVRVTSSEGRERGDVKVTAGPCAWSCLTKSQGGPHSSFLVPFKGTRRPCLRPWLPPYGRLSASQLRGQLDRLPPPSQPFAPVRFTPRSSCIWSLHGAFHRACLAVTSASSPHCQECPSFLPVAFPPARGQALGARNLFLSPVPIGPWPGGGESHEVPLGWFSQSPHRKALGQSLTNSTHCPARLVPETQEGLSHRCLHRKGEGGLLWINGCTAFFATSCIDLVSMCLPSY